jgi:hypothetical protein
MKEHRNRAMRRRGLVAAALSAAAVAVALPVSGAVAGGDSASAGSFPTQAQDQTTPRDDSPRNHGDCPKKDGQGGSGSDSSSSSDASVEL